MEGDFCGTHDLTINEVCFYETDYEVYVKRLIDVLCETLRSYCLLRPLKLDLIMHYDF